MAAKTGIITEMKRWYRHGDALLNEIAESYPQKGESYIWFAGQHGFIICFGGMVLYVDVLLNDLVDKNGRNLRVYPPPFDPGRAQRVDYVFCTHNHIDHLNLETLLPLARANPAARFVVPAPCADLLTRAGIEKKRVLAAKAGEELVLNEKAAAGQEPVAVIPTPAIHTLYPQELAETAAGGDFAELGYVIKGDGITLYHSGDTWITPLLVEFLKALGPFDIAMLPINGTDWERTAQNCIGNAGPQDVAKLAKVLPIDLVFPAHYDMIAHNSENPARFADAMYTLSPEKRFHIFTLGERFIYRKN